jgi:hypothetical protein
MTFAASQAKKSGKRPVWLFRFIVGSEVWSVTKRGASLRGNPGHTTDAGAPDEDYIATQDWTPIVIDNGEIAQSSDAERQEFEITLATANVVGQSIMDYKGTADIQVKVWQTYLDDPDQEYVVKFSGRVRNFKAGILLTTLFCDDGLTDMDFNANPVVIQQPCPHCPYFTDPDDPDAPGCRLDPDDFKVAATVSAISRKTVTIAEAALSADGEYTYGLLIYGSTEIWIESHFGDQITIEARNVALETALLGGPVDVFIAPGCDGSMSRCDGRFSNRLNRLGFDLIKDTPFDGRSLE